MQKPRYKKIMKILLDGQKQAISDNKRMIQ